MEFSNIKTLSDSHFHILEMKKKDIDIDLFFNKWELNNGKYLLDVGIDENNLDERLTYSVNRDYLYHSVGIHPNYCSKDYDIRIEAIEKQLKNSKIIAIGETGLDYYWDTIDRECQKKYFRGHIELAIKYNLPLIVHNRDACHDVLDILTEYKGRVTGIIHCFSSEDSYVNKFIELGFYLSFAGNVTYKKNRDIQNGLLCAPINKILIETDSPYLSPQIVRGKSNHPGNIGFTLDFICEKKEIKRIDLIKTLEDNFLDVFKLRQDK